MEIFLIIFITFITFATRIINLLAIPIFTDEAIYIRWAQIGLADPAHRYIALTDGKQPLLTWLMYPFLKIFTDPLFAGRIVSVLSGVFTVLGLYFVGRELFGKKTAILSSLFYIISPFAMVYDRLALMDSLLAGFGVWSIYLAILLATRLRLDTALLLGITVGFGVLTKSSAFFYLFLLPLSLLLFNFRAKRRLKQFFIWLSYSFISFAIAQIMYNSLRLSPWFYLIKQKNYTFILTWKEFFSKPFDLFLPNLNGLVSILVAYLTPTVIVIILIGIVWGIIKKDKRIVYLFLWFVIPFLIFAAIGKVIFPRFILFMIMPLYVVAAYVGVKFVTFAYQKMRPFLIISLVLVYPMYQSYLLVVSPINAAIHIIDRNQLFDDWPSGYGTKEVIAYLDQKSVNAKVVIGTEGTFGLFPAVFEIYLANNKNVKILSFWPVSEVPHQLLELSLKYPTYLVFKEKQNIPTDWPLRLIARYPRGKGNTYLYFYQVDPDKWRR